MRKYGFKFVVLMLPFLLLFALYQLLNSPLPAQPPANIPKYTVPQENLSLVLVLGGGGVRGLAHVGVLEEFEKAKIPINYIIGCSAGAIVGGLYADQPDAKRLKKLLMPLRRKDLIDFSYSDIRFGYSSGKSLEKFLQKNLNNQKFENLQIPLLVVATDLIRGQLIKIGSGPIAPAVHASSAFPFVYQPVRWEGRYLVDGGVLNPVPADIALQLNANVVVAVDVSEILANQHPTNLFGVVKRSMSIMYASQSRMSAKAADFVIRPKLDFVGVFDDSSNEEVYTAGKEAAKLYIQAIKDRLSQSL